ncbi:MAG: dihydrolipoyl dehydrogenase [candidate division WOR-3 bacterium]
MEVKYDVIVVGAGPGGYVAAIRLAQLGKKVCVIEKESVGGTCLNVGCIPTKALLEVTSLKDKIETFKNKGLKCENLSFNPLQINEWKNSVVSRLVKGVEYLFKQNGVELIRGEAELVDNRWVKVNDQTVQAEHIVLATGSSPKPLPGLEFDKKQIIDSTDALNLSGDLPSSLLIVGGGVIGVEMATIYRRLGVEVTIVEILEDILFGFDRECVSLIRRTLERKGIKIYTGASLEKKEGQFYIKKGESQIEIKPDKVLIATGRKPNTEITKRIDITLDEKGFVKVDTNYSTNISNIYAIGDIIPGPQLAHKASKDGINVAEVIALGKISHQSRFVPFVVYGEPELVKVGLSEEQAKENGIKYRVGKFPFQANGRALTQESTMGLVKILGDEDNRVIGIHIVGPHASEFAGLGALILENNLKVEDVAKTIFPHPTLSEAIMECAENYYKKAIHIVNK